MTISRKNLLTLPLLALYRSVGGYPGTFRHDVCELIQGYERVGSFPPNSTGSPNIGKLRKCSFQILFLERATK